MDTAPSQKCTWGIKVTANGCEIDSQYLTVRIPVGLWPREISINSTGYIAVATAMGTTYTRLHATIVLQLLLACHDSTCYSLSNVIVADEKSTSFHLYLRYSHKCVTIVFSIPSAIIWAQSHTASMVSARFSLFEHVIYSSGALHCRQCRAPQE